jgi:dTDP-4-amino-4,6-dideoxygalactose transaminase
MIKKLKKAIENYLDSNNLFFHYKGRVSLYAILKAMGVTSGDEVIIPAFTCVVVPNPIIYLGAKPVYVDIDPITYNVDVNKIEAAITDKTRVIICQNTFGLSSNVEHIIHIAKKHNLKTIEDCTHGFGGTYRGKPNGVLCDASFFSAQWNKPFSSGVGGFALINDSDLLEPMFALEKEKIPVSFYQKLNLKLLYFVRRYLLTPKTYFPLVRLYRYMSKYGLVLGSSSGAEISSVNKPKDFFKDYSNVQAKEALKSLSKLDKMLDRRKQNADIYTDFLKKHGKNYVPNELFENHSFLKYPLRVKSRDAFLRKAEKANIPMGDWFISPLHPVQQSFAPWYFDPEHFPVAVEAAKQMINLPTDYKHPEKVLDFLSENLNDISRSL